MNINSLIVNNLSSLNVPTTFLKSSSTTFPYITFFEYLQQGEEFCDDGEVGIGHYVQVDVWSKTDYATLVDQVKTNLTNANFKRTSEADLYESDTQIYHKALRFFYLEQI